MDQPKPLLVHKNENILFGVALLFSFTITIYFLISIIGAILFLVLGLLSYIGHALALAHIQLNSLRVKEDQLPHLYEKVVSLSEKMEVKSIPEVYILQSGGALNAFATKLTGSFGKSMVVLYSEFVDASIESGGSELDFVLAHEIAHVKRHHPLKSLLISPAMWVPFIGTSYLRAAELTCDRMAAYYTGEKEGAIDGLLLLASGKRVYKDVNLSAFLQQYNDKKGLFATLSELISTHPPIPKRIHDILLFMDHSTPVPLQKRGKQIAFIWMFLLFIIPGCLGLIGFLGYELYEHVDLSSILFSGGTTPLTKAVDDGDTDRVTQLIKSKADPNEVDSNGDTPLALATFYDDLDTMKLLLSLGADPNVPDDTGWTPLMYAVDNGNLKSGKLLLGAGADPNEKDNDGKSAVDYAKDNRDTQFIQLLNQYNTKPANQ